MSKDPMEEEVLCVNANVVGEFMKLGLPEFNGACVCVDELNDDPRDAVFRDLLQRTTFRKRRQCESDRAYKQVIPYVAITTYESVYSYKRAKGGTETSLHDLLSIGIGGHVDSSDMRGIHADVERLVETALIRELNEEVKLFTVPHFSLRGVINHDDGVGLYHVGLFYECRLIWPDIEVREKLALADGEFVSFGDAENAIELYEPWSQIVLRYLIP
jgi:predicted NUDIX family phosphoesterase